MRSGTLNYSPPTEPTAVADMAFWSRPGVRLAASIVLGLHLLAIVMAPLAMTPTSPLLIAVWRGFRPYLDAMYLNHGFHFFAPDPGPSHLIRYELEFADGSKSEGIFPNPSEHSPRLLYHRHFMLTEFANRIAVDESRAADLKTLSQSFGEHLLSVHQAARVTLHLRRHFVPTPEHVLSGLPLDDPQFIQERLLGSFTANGVTEPTAPPSDAQPAPITEQSQDLASADQPLDFKPEVVR